MSKLSKLFLLSIVFYLVYFTACTFEKRQYRSGYYVAWHHNKKIAATVHSSSNGKNMSSAKQKEQVQFLVSNQNENGIKHEEKQRSSINKFVSKAAPKTLNFIVKQLNKVNVPFLPTKSIVRKIKQKQSPAFSEDGGLQAHHILLIIGLVLLAIGVIGAAIGGVSEATGSGCLFVLVIIMGIAFLFIGFITWLIHVISG